MEESPEATHIKVFFHDIYFWQGVALLLFWPLCFDLVSPQSSHTCCFLHTFAADCLRCLLRVELSCLLAPEHNQVWDNINTTSYQRYTPFFNATCTICPFACNRERIRFHHPRMLQEQINTLIGKFIIKANLINNTVSYFTTFKLCITNDWM